MGYIEVFLFVTLIGYLLYRWSTAKYTVFKNRNIPHEKPVPLLGNFKLKLLFGDTSFLRYTIDQYKQFNGSKVYGVYSFRDPQIFIRDIDMIKKISMKDFDHFPNHRDTLAELDESVLTKTLIMLKDRQWKEMRSTLSPAFTGNKMRLLFELINECCTECVNYINDEIEYSIEQTVLDVEMKDFFTRYTNDVIASAAFGIKINSFKQKDNEFFSIGTTLTQFRGWAIIKAFLIGMMPKVMKFFRVKIMDESKINFFKQIVSDAIKYREAHNILRPDMIHLLMEAKRNFEQTKKENRDSEEHAEFGDDDLLAQCLIFFIAGFETVSTCLCFTAHELAMNPAVQEKLYKEILDVQQELGGKTLNYDTLVGMKYMDQVLSESLRKWPPAILTDRECSADYTLTDDDGNLVAEIKKKDNVMIPIIGIHHDPKYYENPETFDPERFSDENKSNLNAHAYMPFGVGNRSCIGNRFALMETKLIIYHILTAFKIVPGEKTYSDLFNAIKGFQLQPPEMFWVKLVPRTKYSYANKETV